MARKVMVVLSDRANYGRLIPVLDILPDAEIVCTGSMGLEKFGKPAKEVAKHYNVVTTTFSEVTGSSPQTMAKSVGLVCMDMADIIAERKPDVFMCIGDRYETLGAVIAAAYQRVAIVHIQGGELSGTMDNACRDAISMFSHYHCVSHVNAYNRLRRMGQERVSVTGCPVGDLILKNDMSTKLIKISGVGYNVDAEKPYILTILHPDTTGDDDNCQAVIDAVHETGLQVVWLWPNIDAGADAISKKLRIFRESTDNKFCFVKNLDPVMFQRILHNAVLAVGNSSSFVRDAGFHGTKVVLIGDRQKGRYRGSYGDGHAAPRIAEIVKNATWYAK